MKLSLAITTYNRPELTVKAFANVWNDPRIDEVVIVDDASTVSSGQLLVDRLAWLGNFWNKGRTIWNPTNLGMSRNKWKAIASCKNDWCILLDSDNQIDSSYLDALEGAWDGGMEMVGQVERVIYCPSGALPSFDYTEYSGRIIGAPNIKCYNGNTFNCLLNTCNYVVHRETYLKSYVYDPSIKAADTIWHTYNHLKNGGYLYVVPGMFYQHMVHSDSGWMKDRRENSKKFQEIKKMIMAL